MLDRMREYYFTVVSSMSVLMLYISCNSFIVMTDRQVFEFDIEMSCLNHLQVYLQFNLVFKYFYFLLVIQYYIVW